GEHLLGPFQLSTGGEHRGTRLTGDGEVVQPKPRAERIQPGGQNRHATLGRVRRSDPRRDAVAESEHQGAHRKRRPDRGVRRVALRVGAGGLVGHGGRSIAVAYLYSGAAAAGAPEVAARGSWAIALSRSWRSRHQRTARR